MAAPVATQIRCRWSFYVLMKTAPKREPQELGTPHLVCGNWTQRLPVIPQGQLQYCSFPRWTPGLRMQHYLGTVLAIPTQVIEQVWTTLHLIVLHSDAIFDLHVFAGRE